MNSSAIPQSERAADNVTGWFASRVADVGDMAITAVAGIGDVTLFALRTVGWLFSRRQRRDVLMPSFYQIGVLSLPVIALTGLFIGMVLAVQSYAQFKALGLQTRLGSVINLSLIRELGPVLAATMLAGRVGSAMAAELGTMRVTEQIDALKVMGVNTYNYLIFPKIVAMTLYPFIIVISMFLGIFGGYVACITGGFSAHADFIEGLQLEFNPFHVTYAFIKTFLFAMLLATIPAYHGYYMKGGALGVGKASTTSFVWTSVAIIVMNSFVTNLLLT